MRQTRAVHSQRETPPRLSAAVTSRITHAINNCSCCCVSIRYFYYNCLDINNIIKEFHSREI